MFKKIYVDMDGVLADFDTAAEDLLGMPFSQYEEEHGPIQAWARVYENPYFFSQLRQMPHFDALLKLCAQYTTRVTILSSPSRTNTPLCVIQKRQWIDNNLGHTFPAIFEKQKQVFAEPNTLLIDDTPKQIRKWEEAGGVGHLFKSYEGLVQFFKEYDYGNQKESSSEGTISRR